MKQIVKTGGNKTIVITNETIGAIKLNAFLSDDTVNEDLLPTDLDLSKVFLKVILNRNDEDHVIFSDAVQFLVLDSHLDNNFDFVHPLNVTAANMVKTRIKGVAVKEQALIPITLDLPGVINVKGSDELSVELSIGSGAFDAGLDTAVSYIELELVPDVGYESAIAMMKIIRINGGDSTFNPSLGDDVVKVSFINLDKDSILESDSPLESISIKGDKLDLQKTFLQLLSDRYYDFTARAEADFLRHSHLIYIGTELDSCKLNLQMVAANVTAAKNAIVVNYLKADFFTLQRAQEMAEDHDYENIQAVADKSGVVLPGEE